MALTIDELISNKNAHVIIAGPGGNFRAFTSQEFSVGGGADYSSPFENNLDQKAQTINAISAGIHSASGGSIDVPAVVLKSKAETKHIWSNSRRPSFSINLIFVRFRMSDPAVTTIVRDIVKSVYPRGGDGLLQAPGGYNSTDGSNTWTLSVGSYFRASKLVLTEASGSMSKEVVSDGTPLYAEVNVTFETYQLTTEDDFSQFFL